MGSDDYHVSAELHQFVLLVGLLGLMVLGWSVMVELVKDTLKLFKRWFRR